MPEASSRRPAPEVSPEMHGLGWLIRPKNKTGFTAGFFCVLNCHGKVAWRHQGRAMVKALPACNIGAYHIKAPLTPAFRHKKTGSVARADLRF
jgi:hypothetical protein